MVVSVRTDTGTLLGKCENAGRTDVSGAYVRNGYRILSAGTGASGTASDLALPRTAGIS